MPVRCNHCGAELKPHSRFCLNCGQLVDAGTAAPSAPSSAYAAAQSLTMPSYPAETAVPAYATDAAPLAPIVPPAPAPAPASATGYAVLLTFADQSQVLVSGDAVLGRKPEDAALDEGIIAIPLVDPLKSSSRVHLRLYLTPQGVNVVDAGSGNGTQVEHAGTKYEARPGQPFWIEPGDCLWLGDVPVAVSIA